ncbi:MAG: DMT family transporter [Halobacteriaceae archaeon]
MSGRSSPPVPPMVGVAVAVLAVSTSAVLVRLATAPAPVAAFYRVAFTVGVLVPFVRGAGTDLRAVGRRDLLAAGLAGVALAAHFAVWFESIELTTVAASATLVQTQPVFVAVGAALLLGERVSARTAVGVAVATAGAVMMSAGGLFASGTTALGNGLAVLGAAFAAAYVLAGRSLRQRVSLVPYVLVVYAVAAVGLLATALARGDPLWGYPAREWVLFFAMAVGPGLAGHTLVNWALKYVESAVVAVALVGEPVGATILAAALFGEIPGPTTLAGGAVVLVGIVLTARSRSGERESPEGTAAPEG